MFRPQVPSCGIPERHSIRRASGELLSSLWGSAVSYPAHQKLTPLATSRRLSGTQSHTASSLTLSIKFKVSAIEPNRAVSNEPDLVGCRRFLLLGRPAAEGAVLAECRFLRHGHLQRFPVRLGVRPGDTRFVERREGARDGFETDARAR